MLLGRAGGGILAPLTDTLQALLGFLQSGLDAVHVPYSYGYSIILLTFIVKAATYPLTKQQVRTLREYTLRIVTGAARAANALHVVPCDAITASVRGR